MVGQCCSASESAAETALYKRIELTEKQDEPRVCNIFSLCYLCGLQLGHLKPASNS